MIILSLPLTCIVLQVLYQNQQEKDTLMYLKAFVAQDNIACNKGGEYCNPEILKCFYKMTFQFQLFESTRMNILQSFIRMAINILLRLPQSNPPEQPQHTDRYPPETPQHTDRYPPEIPPHADRYPPELPKRTDRYPPERPQHTDRYPPEPTPPANQYPPEPTPPADRYPPPAKPTKPECFYDDQCTLGHKCLDYECIPECISDDHCFPGKRCIKYRCECSNNEHCGDGFYCNRRDYRCYESTTKTTPSPPTKQKPKPIKQCPVCEALDHSGRCISVITMVTKYVMTFKQNNVSADQGILETLTESVKEYGIKHQEENQVSISCNVIKEKPRCQM
ncbi:hypothetical protein KUTeg_002639 [Tegillarca granosa]|uniref:Uncharacterized protein n=1 Tax=Tegillarca granosa TaxID=220873 RepID=A0ABQ9FUV8_TEGGR|nr:hypothetical protein KUTeg_002639 [Tegillarca granosa]